MPTYTEFADSVRDRLADTITQAEGRGLEAVTSVNSMVDKFRPMASKLESMGAKLLPSVGSLPVIGGLPKPAEVIAANTAFIERLLKAQATFALTVLDRVPAAEKAAAKKKAPAKSAVDQA